MASQHHFAHSSLLNSQMRPFITIFATFAVTFLLFPFPSLSFPVDDDPMAHSSYGRELILRGKYEQGLEELRKAYLTFPMNEILKRNLAEGYAALGLRYFKLKQYEQAEENYLKAMEIYPEEPTYILLRGISSYHLKKYDVSRYELERARSMKPGSGEIFYYLGLIQYETGNIPQALELWEQAVKLSPERREISDILTKVRREESVENKMDRGHSSRFDLTFDPGIENSFAMSILDVLESAANQIGSELGHFPQSRVPVGIYLREDFKKMTDSPDWSGALYDGKLRLPFGSARTITPAMRGILYHEYAHAVIFDITYGNCPLWLNEGIAEFFGRLQYNRPLPDLAKATRSGTLSNFRKLESGFMDMGSAEAALAYQQSYAMVNYMVTSYGWHRVRQILLNLGKGMNIDEAIAHALKEYSVTLDILQQEWQGALERGVNGS